jgi:hypothetical protein
MTTTPTVNTPSDTPKELTIQEKWQKLLKDANKRCQRDEVAGSLAGLILSVIFIIFGLIIMLVKENYESVPTWRKLTGIMLLTLGIVGLLISIGFLVADDV